MASSRPPSPGLRIAIVGATSLKGKELKEVLEERPLAVQKLALLDDDEALGRLTEFEGEPAFVLPIEPGTFADFDLIFFASTTDVFTRAHWPGAARSGAAVIDLSHGLLDVPQARVRIPALEKESPYVAPADGPRWFVIPHPVAAVLLTLWGRLKGAFNIRHLVVNAFEPASERGAAGIDELQEQTVRLLSFQKFPQIVFDAQLAFNLLVRYGADSRSRLEAVETVIRREVELSAHELAERLALRVIQVPVFHSHCLSILVEFDEAPALTAVEKALQGSGVTVLSEQDEPAGAIAVAGRDDIVVGPILQDSGRRNAFWLWVAVDNLRLTARAAVEVAESLVG